MHRGDHWGTYGRGSVDVQPKPDRDKSDLDEQPAQRRLDAHAM
jgi:hypothetical protein